MHPVIRLCLLLALSHGGVALSSAAQEASATSEESDLTLSEAAAKALESNPDLAAFAWELRAAEARVLQAGLRPNPELSIEAEEVRLDDGAEFRTRTLDASLGGPLVYGREKASGIRGGFQEAEFTIAVAQLIELGRKRALRVLQAEREVDLVEWDYATTRQAVLNEVAQAFAEVLAAQERLALAEEHLRLARQMEQTTIERVESGDVADLDRAKAETHRIQAELARRQAETELHTAKVALAALWGEPEPRFGRANGSFSEPVTLPSLEALQERLANNPDLARWAAETEHRRAALEAARSAAVPDLTLTAGLRLRGLQDSSSRSWALGTDGGLSAARSRTEPEHAVDTTFVLGVSLPLPVFDRNQGGIREAEVRAAQAADQRRAAEVKAGSALHTTYDALAQAQARALTLRDEIIPRAERAFRLTEEGYRAGKFGRLDVLEAEQTLLDAKSQYTDALAEYHKAAAQVGGLIGEPLFPAEAASLDDAKEPVHEDDRIDRSGGVHGGRGDHDDLEPVARPDE
jgi:cobalt-zinc-cadmium efflux system outer membrane protein